MNKDFELGEDDLADFMGHTIDIEDKDVEGLVPQVRGTVPQQQLAKLNRLAYLLEQYNQASREGGTNKWFVPGTPFGIDKCPKHAAFFRAGAMYNERTFMAGNRCGKSIAGAFEAACHATGVYPVWWNGRTFDKPTNGWAVGSTARATRDTAQKELLGPIGAWGTGMIPKDRLGKFWALAGVPQGVDLIQVKHISGGWSTIGFKNYEQPLAAFYGTALDWAWLDEECPQEHYNEILIRTMTTNGLVFNTFTPLKGLTPMVVQFAKKADYLAGAKKLIGIPEKELTEEEAEMDARLEDITTSKAIIQAGWDDAPWLNERSKIQMEADTPPNMRAARRNGTPSMGSGNVFPITLEEIMVQPFQIPHYFKRLFALDVGWNRTAVLWAAIDPQSDIVYIYDEHYVGEQQPPIHAAAIRSRGEWIPGVIDPASRGRSQRDGVQLMKDYKDLGLRLAPAINAVDAGISGLWQRMNTGTLKVFTSCTHFAEEFVLYRRNDKGKIVDENDHLMDCLRYIQNNLARAKSLDQMRGSPVYSGPTKYNI
jgi:phage terminase large subunit-like protein